MRDLLVPQRSVLVLFAPPATDLYHCHARLLMGWSASTRVAVNLLAPSGCRFEISTFPGRLSSVLFMTFTVTLSSSRFTKVLSVTTMVTS